MPGRRNSRSRVILRPKAEESLPCELETLHCVQGDRREFLGSAAKNLHAARPRPFTMFRVTNRINHIWSHPNQLAQWPENKLCHVLVTSGYSTSPFLRPHVAARHDAPDRPSQSAVFR